jgi:hypothetical protein
MTRGRCYFYALPLLFLAIPRVVSTVVDVYQRHIDIKRVQLCRRQEWKCYSNDVLLEADVTSADTSPLGITPRFAAIRVMADILQKVPLDLNGQPNQRQPPKRQTHQQSLAKKFARLTYDWFNGF